MLSAQIRGSQEATRGRHPRPRPCDSLSDIGATKDAIPALAAVTMADICVGGNPREATLDDVIVLYTAAF